MRLLLISENFHQKNDDIYKGKPKVLNVYSLTSVFQVPAVLDELDGKKEAHIEGKSVNK